MNISIEDKRKEAVARMQALGIFPKTVDQFRRGHRVSISMPPMGAFFWAEGDDLKHIKEFEKEYNCLVYMVIRTYTELGTLDSYLYVSDYREDWLVERGDLAQGILYAYVYNLQEPMYSEFGSIGVVPTPARGLLRVQ